MLKFDSNIYFPIDRLWTVDQKVVAMSSNIQTCNIT